MSLPIPTTTSRNAGTTSLPTTAAAAAAAAAAATTASSSNSIHFENKECEPLYIELVQRSQGDLRVLLSSFFSFLHRRTDLYCITTTPTDDENITTTTNNDSNVSPSSSSTATSNQPANRSMGFKEGDAEKIIIAAFRQFPLRRIPSATAAVSMQQQQQPSPPPPQSKTDGTERTSDSKPKSVRNSNNNKDDCNDTDEIQYTEEGLQIPIGNGGITPQYRWTQTLDECTVLIKSPLNTVVRGKDLQVTIQPNALCIKLTRVVPDNDDDNATTVKDGIVLLEGELSQRIVPSESTWTIESGIIQIILYKQVKTFWDCILIHTDTTRYNIDTSLVDSRRNVSTYDDITQAHIRKILFDQQQISKGLPTSDEISGTKPTIPTLPNGVEYIDQEILDSKMKTLGK